MGFHNESNSRHSEQARESSADASSPDIWGLCVQLQREMILRTDKQLFLVVNASLTARLLSNTFPPASQESSKWNWMLYVLHLRRLAFWWSCQVYLFFSKGRLDQQWESGGCQVLRARLQQGASNGQHVHGRLRPWTHTQWWVTGPTGSWWETGVPHTFSRRACHTHSHIAMAYLHFP